MAIHTQSQQTQGHFNQDTQSNQTAYQSNSKANFNPPVFGLQSYLSAFGSGGEQFEKLYDYIAKKVKYLNEEVKTSEKYSVIKLLKNSHGLNYSAIVVAETYNDLTTAHILIVEKTGEYPDKLIENISGIKYEIIRTPADALDEKLVSRAITALSESLKTDPSNIVIVDGTLVPNEFDINNEGAINDLLQNALNATHSEVCVRVNDYKGVNLSEIINKYRNGKFILNMYFNQDEVDLFNQASMPIRQDVCITLSYKMNNTNNQRSVNQGEDLIEITRTYGYIDFEWSPFMNNGIVNTQKFIPNFVITHIDSKMAPTPDIMFLGIMSAFVLNEDMNWMQAFRPTPAKKNEIDYKDIGALNIEGNIEANQTGFGKKVNTKDKNFTLVDLNNYIQRLVRPNLIISIDVPKAGPETWYTSILSYIKFRNSKDAAERVMNYLQTLTNGQIVVNNVPMFDHISNKIHGGYYKTTSGAIKDLRHLSSYLAFANYIDATNQSPSLIAQYTNSLYNTSIPNELRCAERKKYLDEMSNRTAVYKQYYDRLVFNSSFLINVLNGLRAIGFAPMFNNMGAINDMFYRRSTVDFSQAMLGQDARILGTSNLYSNFWYNNYYGYNRQY